MKLLLSGILLLLFARPTTGRAPEDNRSAEPIRYESGVSVDLTGLVEGIREVRSGPIALRGIHIDFKVEGDTFDVYLGPADFVIGFADAYPLKARVDVSGSKVRYSAGIVILAREVRNGGTTAYLRDRHGRPYWEAPRT